MSGWLGWDVARSLGRDDLEVQQKSTPRARQVPAMVALDIARHTFDAAARLGETDPLRQPGVVLFESMETWCPAGQQTAFVRLLDGWFPNLQFILALDAGARRRFPRRLLHQRLAIPETKSRVQSPRSKVPEPHSDGNEGLIGRVLHRTEQSLSGCGRANPRYHR